MIGQTLSHYCITEKLGQGGMGEVYRAEDTNLSRQVAIKVLPDEFAHDAERLARFEREAKLLASLNHPNIAAIHGLEEADGKRFIVLELVEGQTLADRLHEGPLPLEEALEVCRQIAEGLEAAHEKGIIHRDLKPSNVKVTPEGTVKILDFGLARALHDQAATADLSHSPTITDEMTRPGVVVGTAAYMSPEQARGKGVDRRSDIWSFGVLLYEMLTGKRVFGGETVTDTLAAVIRAEPDWSLLPAATPQHVCILLRLCLRKDVRQRLQAIGDARITLEETPSGTVPFDAAPSRARPLKLWLASGLAIVVIVAAIAGVVVWNLKPSPVPPRPVTRFTITLPPGQELVANGSALALSADGSRLAYVATQDGAVPQIYLYAMDTGDGRPIPGTEGGTSPFFSPERQSLGFEADGKLNKISLKGGVPQALTNVSDIFYGASWSSEHTIAFAPYSSALQQVSDEGGAPQALTHFETGETLHMWPEFLPGSKAVLFEAFAAAPAVIAAQVIATGERKDLIRGQAGDMPRFVPSGHLTYLQAGNLMALPFDPKAMKVKSTTPVMVVRDVGQYSVSATGLLAYVAGKQPSSGNRLVWVTRKNGSEEMLPAPARDYNQPRLSPDGRWVAVDILENAENMQVWLYDFATDHLTPFTFEGSVNRHAVWTPHSERIAFMSNRKGPTQIFWKLADGSGGLEQLTENSSTTAADILPIPYSFSRDEQLLTYVTLPPTGGAEFWVLHVGDRKAQRIPLHTPTDGAPQFSPDGRWLAYVSDDSHHQGQIYVRAYPAPGGPWQISTDGGNEPQWNPNGRELFYRSGDKMMAVDISTQAGFAPGKPRQLFEGRYIKTSGGYGRANYDVSADGQRFLMLKPVEQGQAPLTKISVVLNWSEELKRLCPTGE